MYLRIDEIHILV